MFRKHCAISSNCVSVTVIFTISISISIWLLRHDKDWFYANSPSPCKRGGNITVSSCEEADEKLMLQVEKIVQKICSASERPKRISKKKIIEELGIDQTNFTRRKNKFPKTFTAIEKYIESNHEWRIRKIKWAVKSSFDDQNSLVDWFILRKAGINESLWAVYRPIVSQYIESSSIDKCS